jgi:hypothetical protein
MAGRAALPPPAAGAHLLPPLLWWRWRGKDAGGRPHLHSSAVASRWRPWRSPHRSSPPLRPARSLTGADRRRLPLLRAGLEVAATKVLSQCRRGGRCRSLDPASLLRPAARSKSRHRGLQDDDDDLSLSVRRHPSLPPRPSPSSPSPPFLLTTREERRRSRGQGGPRVSRHVRDGEASEFLWIRRIPWPTPFPWPPVGAPVQAI